MKKLFLIVCIALIFGGCSKADVTVSEEQSNGSSLPLSQTEQSTSKSESQFVPTAKPEPGTEGKYALSLVPEWASSDVHVATDPDVPDFLNPDQQNLFRAAKRMYLGLPGCSPGYKKDYSVKTKVCEGEKEYTYVLDTAFKSYADFKATLQAVFTDKFCDELLPNKPGSFVIEFQGKLYARDADRGANITFISQSYKLINKTDNEIVFNFIGVYNDDHPKMDNSSAENRDKTKDYFETKTVKMVLTDHGWRFDNFAIMK